MSSTWRLADEVPTDQVIGVAILRMGTTVASAAHVAQISHYLTDQQWLVSAADLRVALHHPTQWTALDIPARLKLAMQEVLDEWDPAPLPSGPINDMALECIPPSPQHAVLEDGSWLCVQCQFRNTYQDSFCTVCFEHYSVSVPMESPTAPSAPDFNDDSDVEIVCAFPVAAEAVCSLMPYPSLEMPPPAPAAAQVIPVPKLDDLSEHFKALAFNKAPPSTARGDATCSSNSSSSESDDEGTL
ncbi:Aste57867_22754 [Aphanomyces stellatus]|uniref:Aste57867_22754 protein n=1 Tax=Aphanomyces stellatus TaxID=120398 RepID=A0A485LL02_9STRA|nr:hypothetical protein As57867_022684 [Aphanomyces stellatus]VFT99407.1 Aste57867_22754 [Aphanomyces stellatus]